MKNCKTCDYKLKEATVLEADRLCRDILALKIKLDKEKLSFKPGQFIMLSIFGYGEVPVTITTTPDIKNYFEVAVRSVGTVTRAINRLKAGDKVGVRGPYGNGYNFHDMHGHDVTVIAGGLGIAPLRSLIEYAKNHPKTFKSFQILYGAKNPDEVLYDEELFACEKFARTILTVDEAKNSHWHGHKGIITEHIDKMRITTNMRVIMCGPPIMYKFLIPEIEKFGIPDEHIQILLERRMKCGIGKCQHCTFGDKYVCLNGPVFKYSEIKNNVEAI